MMQIAARAHFLDRREVAALVVHARQAVARELLRDVRDAIAVALRDLLRRERWPLSGPTHRSSRPVRHASVELSARVTIEGSAGRIWRVLRDAGHRQRFGVVERGVPATMLHDNWMFCRHLIEVMSVERPLVFQ